MKNLERVVISHIFREANNVEEILSNLVITNSRPIMWNENLLECKTLKVMIDHDQAFCKVGDFENLLINKKHS